MCIWVWYVTGCLFTDIVRIDHLWEFTSLVRLDLNTNLIEKIEGLERLVNLTWLSMTTFCIYILFKDVENDS